MAEAITVTLVAHGGAVVVFHRFTKRKVAAEGPHVDRVNGERSFSMNFLHSQLLEA